jgi:hypothetical protein
MTQSNLEAILHQLLAAEVAELDDQPCKAVTLRALAITNIAALFEQPLVLSEDQQKALADQYNYIHK